MKHIQYVSRLLDITSKDKDFLEAILGLNAKQGNNEAISILSLTGKKDTSIETCLQAANLLIENYTSELTNKLYFNEK